MEKEGTHIYKIMFRKTNNIYHEDSKKGSRPSGGGFGVVYDTGGGTES